MTTVGSHGQTARQGPLPPGEPLLELWLPADPHSVPVARREARRACREVGITDEECAALDLALGEALANAVVHGSPAAPPLEGSTPPHICLSLWRYQDQLIVKVHDTGPGFEPPPPPYALPPDIESTHGRGLPLMQALTDAMIVCQGDASEGGSSVYLVKKVGGA